MLPGKLFYSSEHDVSPCAIKLKESHRHKLGFFWPASCELAHVRRAFHRRLLAEVELATSKYATRFHHAIHERNGNDDRIPKNEKTQGGSKSGGHRVSRKSEE
jgi:hypothetical protein